MIILIVLYFAQRAAFVIELNDAKIVIVGSKLMGLLDQSNMADGGRGSVVLKRM